MITEGATRIDRTRLDLGDEAVARGGRIEVMPAAPELDEIQDAVAKLLALFSKAQDAQAKQAAADAASHQSAQKVAERERAEALAKAKDAGGLLQWVQDDLGLLGVAGLATFNYGLVGVDLAIHKTGLVDELRLDLLDLGVAASGCPQAIALDFFLRKSELAPADVRRALDDLGLGKSVPGIEDSDVKPVVDKALLANMMVAGAAASVLTAGSTTALVIACIGLALSVAGTAVQAAGGPTEVALGLQIAGAAAAAGSGFAALGTSSGAASAAMTAKQATARAASRQAYVATGAKIVSGTSAAVQGADTVTSAISRKNADEASIAAEQAKQALTKLERLLDQVIDALTEAKDSYRRTTASITGALETHANTLTALSTGLKA